MRLPNDSQWQSPREIQPEMHKAFGVERLSCLTLLFNIVWESGTAANWGGGSPVKKGGLESVPIIEGSH